MKIKQYKTFLLILLIAALGGGVPVFIKSGISEIPPLNFIFWRFLAALLVLLPILYIQKRKLLFTSFKKLFSVLLFGAGNIFIFVFGVKLTTASVAQMIYTFAPLLAGILSYFMLGEKIGTKKIIGVVLGFLGTLFIILLPVITGDSHIGGAFVGNLLVLCAVISHSIYTVLSKTKQKEFSPIEITASSAVFITLLSLLLIPASGGRLALPPAHSLFPILYTSVAGTAIFFLVYQYIIKISSPLVASTVLYLQSVFTFIWAILLLDEKITMGLIAGMVLVFVGVYIASTQKQTTKMNQE